MALSQVVLLLLVASVASVWWEAPENTREQLAEELDVLTQKFKELEERLDRTDTQIEYVEALGETLGEKMAEGLEKLGEKQMKGLKKLGELLGEKLAGSADRIGETISECARQGEVLTAILDKLGQCPVADETGSTSSPPTSSPTTSPTTIPTTTPTIPAIIPTTSFTTLPTTIPTTFQTTSMTTSPDEFTTTPPSEGFGSCLDLQEDDLSDGVHTLTVNGRNITAYCDQDTDGGGWTVIQRRVDDSVDFYRTWDEYERGFGDLGRNFWLGLSNIHLLTTTRNYSLRVDLQDFDNDTAYAVYESFYIDGPEDNYSLHLAGYHGTAGDSMLNTINAYCCDLNETPFTTKDRDNDRRDNNCAVDGFFGGWWYRTCTYANLNGRYYINGSLPEDKGGIFWRSWKAAYVYLKGVEMKIRPSDEP